MSDWVTIMSKPPKKKAKISNSKWDTEIKDWTLFQRLDDRELFEAIKEAFYKVGQHAVPEVAGNVMSYLAGCGCLPDKIQPYNKEGVPKRECKEHASLSGDVWFESEEYWDCDDCQTQYSKRDSFDMFMEEWNDKSGESHKLTGKTIMINACKGYLLIDCSCGCRYIYMTRSPWLKCTYTRVEPTGRVINDHEGRYYKI